MSKLTKKQKILVEKVDPEKTYSVSEALEIISMHLRDPSEIRILKALLSKKSPTRILDLFPQRKFAVFFPLLFLLLSTTSSWRSVAVWMYSITDAKIMCLLPE